MALVVDVGQIYVERGELQSSADAAALAVARACATNTTDCDDHVGGASALAERYANENSSDGVTHLEIVCGSADVLDPARRRRSNLTACLGEPARAPATGSRCGSAPNCRATGSCCRPRSPRRWSSPDYDGVSVGACARASWTEPLNVTILELAMSTCDYDDRRGGRVRARTALPASALAARRRPSARQRQPVVTRPTRAGPCLTVAGIDCEVLLPDDHVIGGHGLVDGRSSRRRRLRKPDPTMRSAIAKR